MSDAPAGLQNSAAVGVDYAPPGEEAAPKSTGPTPKVPAGSDPYDPGEHTVAEVHEYLAAHPDQAEAVLAAEAAGKNRTTLVEG
jgi:hypothetical protein